MHNKIPPPIVALISVAIMFGISRLLPEFTFIMPFKEIIVAILLLASISIMAAGIWEFRRASTTVNPLKPDTASSLVDGGIFNFTRNPMYLGMTGIQLALFIYLGNIISALLIPLFVMFIHHFQIKPEEQAMAKLFPSAFAPYCQRVRRWV